LNTEETDIMEKRVKHRENSEQLYRELIETANSVIIRFDTQGIIVYCNRFAEKFFGWTAEKLIGRHIVGSIVPEMESTGRNLRTVMENIIRDPERFIDHTNENIRRNGERTWISWTNKAIHDEQGVVLEIMSIGNDITEQKRAQTSCLEKEARFRALSDSSPDIIITMNGKGVITYVNSAWEKLLGHSLSEVLGCYFNDFAKKEDFPAYRKLFREIRDEGKIVNNFITTLIAKDGSERIFNSYANPVRDSEGLALGIVASFKDITEYRDMERKLSHAQRLESIGTLAGGIAHDFNNLLMGIQGNISLLLATVDPSDPQVRRLQSIEEQVKRGADLTRQLLGFAREGRYEPKPSDMNEIIVKTSSLFGKTKKEISIDLNIQDDLPTVEVDQGQMEQMLMNLYVNAAQAMPDGGNLCIGTQRAVLDHKTAAANEVEPGDYVTIAVRDSGKGMDKKTLERIFDPFFSTKARGRGTGLGLATVYGLVKGHKGMIEVTSAPGQGTIFRIYLPAISRKPVPDTVASSEKSPETATILLVDDEKTVLETTGELISMFGYRVYPVGSGQEAIATFLAMQPKVDLVILDMIMPGISGGATFDRLREINPEVRVLLSSGYSLDGQARDIMNRGCKGFIQKPFTMNELSQKIKTALAG
jgi:PAS domain S-box-containing protein